MSKGLYLPKHLQDHVKIAVEHSVGIYQTKVFQRKVLFHLNGPRELLAVQVTFLVIVNLQIASRVGSLRRVDAWFVLHT